MYQSLNEGLNRFAQSDPSVLASDWETHFNKVVKEKYVYLDFLGILHWEHRDCRLKTGQETISQAVSAPVFVNNSALTVFFSDM